jgi:hypothetical protein
MMLYRILFLMALACLLQGCIVEVIGVAKYPEALITLKPEKSRYFKYEGEILINGSVTNIENVWFCEHTRYFTSMDMAWHLKWVPSQKVFFRAIDQQSAVYIELPDVCSGNVQLKENSLIGYIKDASKLDVIQLFPSNPTGNLAGSMRALNQSIVKVEGNVQESIVSDLEREILNKLKRFNYTTIIAIEFHENDWMKSHELKKTLKYLYSISLSSITHPSSKGHTPWFPGYDKFLHLEHDSKHIYLTLENDEWIFKEENEIIYYQNTNEESRYADPRSKSIRYGEFKFSYDSGPQLYDPATKKLYTIINKSL